MKKVKLETLQRTFMFERDDTKPQNKKKLKTCQKFTFINALKKLYQKLETTIVAPKM